LGQLHDCKRGYSQVCRAERVSNMWEIEAPDDRRTRVGDVVLGDARGVGRHEAGARIPTWFTIGSWEERLTIMDCTIYCLVDASGHVYVKDGAVSHSEVAANFGLDEHGCDTYRFDLTVRRLLVDRGKPASDRAAHTYWDRRVGSPEKLMTFAAEGRLTKQVLGSLLGADYALTYLDACTVIEKQYTADCALSDPCLESGCAAEGEICLEPLLRRGLEYHRACGAAWRTVFEDPQHRTKAWMH
jgi:hypothetical protein